MPTYEYACKDCGEHLEVVQSFKDDALTECPSCRGNLRKVFSAAGIIFKGSGWHVKDYASKSNRSNNREGGSSDDGADTDASDTKDGSETTPSPVSGKEGDTSSGGKDVSSAGSAKKDASSSSGSGANSKPAEKKSA